VGDNAGGAATARQRRARAARHGLHRGGTRVSDAWAPTGSGRKRERSGMGRVSRPGKERGVG
jgi:hypothetical protein